ncbi:MAG TPA: hypothetical protein VEA59_00180 [Patescibacteria group bacterium]|nr:hypothetical protein [Patescibacteria group bacterium]
MAKIPVMAAYIKNEPTNKIVVWPEGERPTGRYAILEKKRGEWVKTLSTPRKVIQGGTWQNPLYIEQKLYNECFG